MIRMIGCSLLFLVTVTILSSCVWLWPQSPIEPEIVIPATTKILDPETEASLVEVTDEGTFIFTKSTTFLSRLNVGDVLVCGVSPLTPYGLLRKVEVIRTENGQVIVETSQATLEDAIETGTIEFTGVLTPEGVVITSGLNKFDFLSTTESAGNFYINKEIAKFDGVWTESTISFYPQIEFKAKIKKFTLKELRFIVKVSHTTEVRLGCEATTPAFNKKKDIWKRMLPPKTILVPVPGLPHPLPLVFTPVVTVSVGVIGNGMAGLTTSVTQKGTVETGLIYDGSRWHPIGNFTKDFEWETPRPSAGGKIKGYCGPQFNLLLYGVLGPYGILRAFLELDVGLFRTPWWELYGGLEAAAGVRLAILSRKIVDVDFPMTIGYRKLLAQAEIGRRPTAVTGQATNVTATSATLNAMVNPNGLETSAYFEWGTTTSFGNRTPTQSVGSGTKDVPISADLSGLASGTTYYFRVVAKNSAGEAYGVSSSFKTLEQVPSLLPDLAMQAIWIKPEKFEPGGYVTLYFQAQNIGQGDAIGNFQIGMYFDDTLIGTATLNGLAKGKRIVGYKENFLWPSDTNFHTVKVVLDIHNTIKETNEVNNALTAAFRASAPPEPTRLPDLIVEEIDTGIFHPGETVMIVVTIRNQGAGDAVGIFDTDLYFDGKWIGHHIQNGLAAGSSFYWKCFFTWPDDFDLHTLTAVVDAYNVIKESNENNNRLSVQIRARDYPIPPEGLEIKIQE